MRLPPRALRTVLLLGTFGFASHLALEHGSGTLWRGLRAAHAVVGAEAPAEYDLTQLRAVNATLELVRKKYVDPARVEPRQMFLSALDQIQKTVAPVIISHAENDPEVRVQVFDHERKFRVDNVQGPWDVAARMREVFVFLQEHLRGTDIKLPEVEYAAANGMLRTLDPHSVFLSPEAVDEMNVSTSGHFGGLGIVISIRDQMLTVMRPMAGTPAGRAGLKRLDRIVKINSESTLNMPLEDAVTRLRGEPSSKVEIWIEREGKEGWKGSRPFELVREIIRVNSVEKKALDNSIGYVRIKQFQQTTARELQGALLELRSKGALKGLVLDLRDDPGGLLDQAKRVVDTFLSEGTIYATEGYSEERHEAQATRSGTEPNYPIVVLVNGNSASASEIVSGALRNNERAIVIGQKTFGKGSVQLVFPDVTAEGAALKLTIAQYLTPGDISIQGVGVNPDIELQAMTVDPLEMDLFANEGSLKERDLAQVLGAGGRRAQKPTRYKLRYQLPESIRAEIRERGATVDDDSFELDAPIQIARDLAASMSSEKSSLQLDELKEKVAQLETEQMQLVERELSQLNVDWSAPPADALATTADQFKVSLASNHLNDAVQAGESLQLKVKVENTGETPIYRLRGITKSEPGFYNQRELLFGKLEPGEVKEVEVPLGWCSIEGWRRGSSKPKLGAGKRSCKIPMDAVTRQDAVSVRFAADGGEPPADVRFFPRVTALAQPSFAYSYYVVEDRNANGNGQLEKGEGATLYFRVKNVGVGAAHKAQASLSNLSGDGVLLNTGRFDISNLKPGEEKEVAFSFDILEGLNESEIKLRLSAVDRDLRVFSGEKIVLPVAGPSNVLTQEAHRLVYEASSAAPVLDSPGENGNTIGLLKSGSLLQAHGKFGDYLRVQVEPTSASANAQKLFGYVRVNQLSASAALPAKTALASLDMALIHSPPLLKVKASELATEAESVAIEVDALDASGGIQDAYVFLGSRKIFYQPNAEKGGKQMQFKLDVPLKPGVNLITVVARENEEISTRRVIVVRKDGPGGEILPTPRHELLGEDWEFGN